MISVRGLKKRYRDGGPGGVPVLEGLELAVAKGEFVAVVGPSGSGKSTLLHVLGGLDAHFEGEVEVAGVRLKGLADGALARFRSREVGFVFQSFHLVPQLSARDNVLLPSFFRDPGQGPVGARARAEGLLQRVGLAGKEARFPSRLSGGERQRVAIARALFFGPSVLLCDEPTGNLDQTTGAEIIALFKSLHGEGLTVLAVTHEERLSAVADRVLRIQGGRLHGEPGGTGRAG